MPETWTNKAYIGSREAVFLLIAVRIKKGAGNSPFKMVVKPFKSYDFGWYFVGTVPVMDQVVPAAPQLAV